MLIMIELGGAKMIEYESIIAYLYYLVFMRTRIESRPLLTYGLIFQSDVARIPTNHIARCGLLHEHCMSSQLRA